MPRYIAMTDDLIITATSRADLAEIDALFARSYPALLAGAYPPSILVTAIPLIAKANPMLVSSGTYFGVRNTNGEIVGAGGWTGRDPSAVNGTPATGHIRHVVTDHRAVRKGIGRSLMAHILEDARAAGIMRLECLSTLMAVPFYAACGFAEVAPVTVTLRPGIEFPAVRLQREI
ncbi:MAG: GNAT family N-acetyltransferase [Silicimonas sp.]|nr:GNAT family N-acetyltransferase [Silicimonas sp.]